MSFGVPYQSERRRRDESERVELTSESVSVAESSKSSAEEKSLVVSELVDMKEEKIEGGSGSWVEAEGERERREEGERDAGWSDLSSISMASALRPRRRKVGERMAREKRR